VVIPGSGPTLHSGNVGVAYAQNFFLSGGVAPYTWSVAAGQLPPGLALTTTNAPADNNNQLPGTPTAAGTFTMKVTDSAGHQASNSASSSRHEHRRAGTASPAEVTPAAAPGSAGHSRAWRLPGRMMPVLSPPG
jgi:hypothetical protein